MNNYKPLPALQTSKKGIDKGKLLVIVLAVLLIATLGYVLFDKIELCEGAKTESFNQGVEQWNAAVVSKVTGEGLIPYWFNGTYFELNIQQMCGGEDE